MSSSSTDTNDSFGWLVSATGDPYPQPARVPAGLEPAGQLAMGPCPRQLVIERLDCGKMHRAQLARRRRRAACSQSRSTRARIAGVEPVDVADGELGTGLRGGRTRPGRARRGRPAAGRRCGPAPRPRRPAARPRAAAAPRCAAAPAGSAGRRCAGRPRASRPSAAQAARCRRGGARAAGGGSGPRDRAHAGDRARPRAAAEAEQHGLGLVVEGVPEQDGRARRRSQSERGVAGGPGRGLGPAGPGRVDLDPDQVHRVEAELVADRGHPPRLLGRSGLQAVVDRDQAGRRSPARGASNASAAARASESAPPEQATNTGLAGDQALAHCRAHRGDRRMRSRHRVIGLSRGRARSTRPGRRSRPWSAGSPGPSTPR